MLTSDRIIGLMLDLGNSTAYLKIVVPQNCGTSKLGNVKIVVPQNCGTSKLGNVINIIICLVLIGRKWGITLTFLHGKATYAELFYWNITLWAYPGL